MAPPPPGPIILKLPGRGVSPLPLARRRNPRSARRKKSVILFLCFPYHLFRFLSWQNPAALSIPFFSFRSKMPQILIFLKKLPGHARLAAKLPDASGHLHMHVRKAIHTFRHVGEIFGIIAHMKHNELRLGMAFQNTVARFQNFSVTWKILPIE